LIVLSANKAFSQIEGDWPSNLNYFVEEFDTIGYQVCDGIERKHRVVISKSRGEEFYCDGALHATGSLVRLKSEHIIYANESNRRALVTEYIRDGVWKVYYDISPQTIRSEGNYADGMKEGIWNIYSIDGNIKYRIDYRNDVIKTKTEVDSKGNRNTLISKSDVEIFVGMNKVLLLLIGLIPITGFRITYNIKVYNKIYNTHYIPFLQDFQKGGSQVNLMCTVVFWWLIKADDTKSVVSYKKNANAISLFSIVCCIGVMLLLSLYGSN
jgi:hypothetical protein